GAVAGAVSRTCTAPLDRLKVLLQTTTQIHSGNPAASVTFRMVYRSISDGMIKIYREGGIRSFWRGNGLNCLKIIPESAIKFYVFEQSKIYIARFKNCQIDEIGVSGRFLAGGFGGFVSQFSIYPIETLKTRIMAATQSPTSPYKGMGGTRLVSVISKQLWREGKIKPFFRGLTPSLFGIVPYAGLDLGIYESLKTFYAHMVLDRGEVNTQPSVPLLLLFGTISGSIGAVAVYPLSLVRTR
ncbi:mitochondrial carrier domain-containing protein, partial [Paraphysoderma sedebokerense]